MSTLCDKWSVNSQQHRLVFIQTSVFEGNVQWCHVNPLVLVYPNVPRVHSSECGGINGGVPPVITSWIRDDVTSEVRFLRYNPHLLLDAMPILLKLDAFLWTSAEIQCECVRVFNVRKVFEKYQIRFIWFSFIIL